MKNFLEDLNNLVGLKTYIAFWIIAIACGCIAIVTLKNHEEAIVHRAEVLRELQKEQTNFPAKYVGEFKFTHYCSCKICTNKAKPGNTKTGHRPRQGRTIAVDPKIIPLHSVVYIEGQGYFVAEDIGGAIKGKKIDIYVDNHNEALKLGTLGGKKLRVWIMEELNE